jgi:6-phosphogluconate dehydrogenase
MAAVIRNEDWRWASEVSKKRVTNLIQTQRDYIGARTYERVDFQGTFHPEWGKG